MTVLRLPRSVDTVTVSLTGSYVTYETVPDEGCALSEGDAVGLMTVSVK
jgi:hypothetical protein